MESKLSKKLTVHAHEFKNDLKGLIDKLVLDDKANQELSAFIFNYPELILDHSDFMKRKRIVSSIPLNERCIAKKANNDQCTRRKKDNCEYCGTHEKCQPHGIIDNVIEKTSLKKCEIHIRDIKGIIYYTDNEGNIYDSSDILHNKVNPKIIAKYTVTSNNIYNILNIDS